MLIILNKFNEPSRHACIHSNLAFVPWGCSDLSRRPYIRSIVLNICTVSCLVESSAGRGACDTVKIAQQGRGLEKPERKRLQRHPVWPKLSHHLKPTSTLNACAASCGTRELGNTDSLSR